MFLKIEFVIVDNENSFQSSLTKGKSNQRSIIIYHQDNTNILTIVIGLLHCFFFHKHLLSNRI